MHQGRIGSVGQRFHLDRLMRSYHGLAESADDIQRAAGSQDGQRRSQNCEPPHFAAPAGRLRDHAQRARITTTVAPRATMAVEAGSSGICM